MADITEDVTVSKAVTIDGAGKTYTGKMTLKADTTIKNVNFDGKNSVEYAVVTGGANYVTVEGCTAKNYTYGFVQLSSATALTTVKNVTVSNMNYGVKVDYSGAVVLENVDITANVSAVLNSNYGDKTITIKNSKLNILGTWTRNNTIKTTYVFEGANTVGQFKTDAAIDSFKLVVGATLTAPADLTVISGSELNKVEYTNGTYHVVTTVGVEYTNIRFGSSLSLIFAIGGQGKFGLVDGDYVIITPKTADGKGTKLTRGNGLDWTVVTIGNEQYYAVEFSGLAAKQMTDEVSVQIFSKDGVALSPVFTTSIREYAMKRLNAAEAAPEFKTLVINMLNYGAAAQKYFEYNEGNLANAGLGQTSGTVTFPDNYVPGKYLLGVSARFANTTSLIFKFSSSMAQEGMTAVFTYTNHYGVDCTVNGAISVDNNDGNFVVELQALTLADARQVVTCTIYGADGETITEVQDSIASYCGRPTEEAMKTLANAYMKFADSSYAYLHPTKK